LARHGRIRTRRSASQCLDRRIADKKILAREVTAWQDHATSATAKANWQFTTANTHVKLKRLNPQFEWLGRLAAPRSQIRTARTDTVAVPATIDATFTLKFSLIERELSVAVWIATAFVPAIP
jgi:hypothetical protein